MKTYDNGAFYTVAVHANEVRKFNESWPGSRLPNRTICFQFDKRNGDLVDIMPASIADEVDGPEAVALSQDAQEFGRKLIEGA